MNVDKTLLTSASASQTTASKMPFGLNINDRQPHLSLKLLGKAKQQLNSASSTSSSSLFRRGAKETNGIEDELKRNYWKNKKDGLSNKLNEIYQLCDNYFHAEQCEVWEFFFHGL